MSLLDNIFASIEHTAQKIRDMIRKPMTKEEAVAALEWLASRNEEKLQWQTSVVDLLKLLRLDSSLDARQELAVDLGLKGSLDDSQKMNIDLHKLIMDSIEKRYIPIPKK